MKKTKYKLVFGYKLLPMSREIKPIGRYVLFGKELLLEETARYIKTITNIK